MKLVRYEAARAALAAASRVDEVKEIQDQAEALRVYAKQTKNVEMERWVAEIKLRATVRIGELSRELEKGAGRPSKTILPNGGKNYKADALKAANISKSEANRAEQLAGDGAREAVEFYIAEQATKLKPVTITEALKHATKAAKRGARHNRQKRRLQEAALLPHTIEVHHGDITAGLHDVASDSLDAIVTDPPYGEDALPLYTALATFAARTLKPGGHCLVMTGQSHLPTILALLTKKLLYWWMLAYVTPGTSVQVFGRKIKSNWKPVLWLCKERISREQEHETDVVSSDQEPDAKDLHEWGQTVSGMVQLVRRFTAPGALVCDPFCGSGTTGVACLLEGRRFIGFDNSETAIAKAQQRLAASAA